MMRDEDVAASAPVIGDEPILQSETRDISILVARDNVTITRARYAVGQQVAGPTCTTSTPTHSTCSRAN